jgi:hypothetical protein
MLQRNRGAPTARWVRLNSVAVIQPRKRASKPPSRRNSYACVVRLWDSFDFSLQVRFHRRTHFRTAGMPAIFNHLSVIHIDGSADRELEHGAATI